MRILFLFFFFILHYITLECLPLPYWEGKVKYKNERADITSIVLVIDEPAVVNTLYNVLPSRNLDMHNRSAALALYLS